jgi:hypothetical protein
MFKHYAPIVLIFCVACGGAKQNQALAPESAESLAPAGSEENASNADNNPALEGFEFRAAVDEDADFTKYKTYAWTAIAGGLNDPDNRWTRPELDVINEVKFLIDRELRAMGWTEVADNPDGLIAYGIVVDMEAIRVKYDPNNTMAVGEIIPTGALYIALVDGETNNTAWLGGAAAPLLEGPEADVVKQRLDYAVTNIISTLPR